MRYTVVADDLSGAMEVAGEMSAGGAPTVVVVDPVYAETSATDSATVINLETRQADRDQVRARYSALREHFGVGDRLVMKVDSALRGDLPAECRTVLACGLAKTILVAPANPDTGRYTENGMHHIPTSDDGDTVVDLLEWFRRAGLSVMHADVRSLRRLTDPKVSPNGQTFAPIVIADARTHQDIAALSLMAQRQATWAVAAASPLCSVLIPRESLPSPLPGLEGDSGRKFVVVGSQQTESLRQIEVLEEAGATVIHTVEELSDDDHVVVLRPRPQDAPRSPEFVVRELTKTAMDCMERLPFWALVCTGGDTAWNIARALGIRTLTVHSGGHDGLVFGRTALPKGMPQWLGTKPGFYGGIDALLPAVWLHLIVQTSHTISDGRATSG